MPPTLSIVTPSFNQAHFLEETLRSVVSQRGAVHEYFVYDGGSSDGSADVIRTYAHGIDHWVSERDAGQADAVARGFARASGDYLAWINSDDLYLPGALERVRAALTAHPEWDVVSGDHVRIDAESRVVSAHRYVGESTAAARRGIFHACQPTVFFRRSLYEKVGGLKRDLYMVLDTELFFRFLDAGAVWGHVPAYQVAFRMHGSTKTTRDQAKVAHEYAFLDRQYAHYHAPTPGHYAGRAAHKAMQFLSGRELAARRDARRWRGRTVGEVFGITLDSEPADKSGSMTPTRPG